MRELQPREKRLQLLIAAILLAPLLVAFWGSGGFTDAYNNVPSTNGASAARQGALMLAMGRSLLIGFLAVLIALVLGIPAGWALAQRQRRLWLLVLTALPLALPASVAVSGWVALLAPTFISTFAQTSSDSTASTHGILFSVWGAAIILGCGLWPIVAFELWPAFKQARNESYDAAVLCGSRARAFMRIVLPQVKGELAAGALLVFLLASNDFSVSSLLLIRTLPIEIHDALTVGKTASAAWAALPLILEVCIMAVILGWCRTGQKGYQPTSNSSLAVPVTCWARIALISGILLGFVLPMWACYHGITTEAVQPLSQSFKAGLDSLGSTFRLAGAATLLSILVAVLRLVVWPDTRNPALNAAGLFLLAVPGSFLAAALLEIYTTSAPLLKHLPLNVSAALPTAMLTLGYLMRFIYLPLRLVEEGLAGIDPDMMDAAAMAGHGRISRAVTIALPLLGSHIAAAAALVFILSLGELPIADRLHPPGVTPAMVWLFQQQHMGYDETVFGLSLLLGVVAAVTLLASGILGAIFIQSFQHARVSQLEVRRREL